MIVKLLAEHHLEFLSLQGGCRGSSVSTLVKMSSCWKSHAVAQLYLMLVFSRYYEHIEYSAKKGLHVNFEKRSDVFMIPCTGKI